MSSPDRAPVLDVADLRVSLRGRVLAEIPALRLAPGECVALVGESGSGKTTTLLALLGLVQEAGMLVAGRAQVCGVDVVRAGPGELNRLRGSRVALVMQSPQSALNPTMRLGTLLRRALARHGVRGEAARPRTAEALAAVRLDPELLDRYPHQVSGGQAQRFGLALAVALGAEVILADEPTSALDVTVQAEVVAVLRRLQVERGLAMLLVSHDLALVSGLADEVLVMREGRVVESGPAERVLLAPQHAYTAELVAAVPTLPEPT